MGKAETLRRPGKGKAENLQINDNHFCPEKLLSRMLCARHCFWHFGEINSFKAHINVVRQVLLPFLK